MRLLLAVAISSIAFAALFSVASFFGVPRDIACAFAAPVFAAIPYLHRKLVRRGEKTEPIVPLSGYAYPDGIVFVYAFFTTLGTVGFVAAASIVFEYISSNETSMLVVLSMSPLLSIGVPLLFLAGKWIGVRSSRRGPFIAAAVVIALTAVMRAYEVYLIPVSAFELVYIAPPSMGNILRIMLKNLIVWGLPIVIGFWLGRRSRRMAYAGYLLQHLSPAGGDALIDRMYDDAKSMR